MASIDKNTDLGPLKKWFLETGKVELVTFKPMEIPPPWHLHKTGTTIFRVECKEKMERTEIKCPICEMLKEGKLPDVHFIETDCEIILPTTKWQRIKSWKLWNHYWLPMAILIALMGLCLQIWHFVTMLVQF